MDAWTATMFVLSNILTLFIGFMLGDENHHETAEVNDELDFNRHVQQALFITRPTQTERD